MKTHPSLANITKAYAHIHDEAWANTQMVRHDGTVIAFAQTVEGHFYYTVLNFSNPDKADKFKDVDFWDNLVHELRFPTEIVTAGAEAFSMYEMPVFRENGGIVPSTETLPPDKRHKVYSTTLSLSSPDKPFKVVSDGRYIYLFRQSKDVKKGDIEARAVHADPKHRRDTVNYSLQPTILVDRFVFDGAKLNHKLEQRYQRSRNKHLPLNRKDTLGYKDLNNHFFFEPTYSLEEMVGKAVDGYFTALLVPTMLPDVQNWQFFVWDSINIRAINLLRSEDGLFDERGRIFYISSAPQKYPEIFTTMPGEDPDGNALIPWQPSDDQSKLPDLQGGKQEFEITSGGHHTCYGMDAIVYAQQSMSKAPSGYGSTSKPVLRQQRMLLAVSARDYDEGDEPQNCKIITLDFGISQDGRLGYGKEIRLQYIPHLKNTNQADNEQILKELLDLQTKRAALQVATDVTYLKTQKESLKAEFGALFNGAYVQLYQGNNYSTSTLSIRYAGSSFPDIEAELTDTYLKVRRYIGKDSSGDDRSNDTSSYWVYGDLKISNLSDREGSIQKSTADNHCADLPDALNDDFGSFDLEPKNILKQEMLLLQRRYQAVVAEEEQKQKDLAAVAEEIKALTDPQKMTEIEKLDRQISEKVRSGDWETRISTKPIDRDMKRNLTINGGILDFAWSQHPPQLVKNADGRVSMFFRGDHNQAFVAHYDVTKLDKHVYDPNSGIAENLKNTAFVIRLLLPQDVHIDGEVFILGGTNPTQQQADLQRPDNYTLSLNSESLIYYQNRTRIQIPTSEKYGFIKGDYNILIITATKSEQSETPYSKIDGVYINGSEVKLDNCIVELNLDDNPVAPSEFHLYKHPSNTNSFSGDIVQFLLGYNPYTPNDWRQFSKINHDYWEYSDYHVFSGAHQMQWVANKPGLAIKPANADGDGGENDKPLVAKEFANPHYVSKDAMTVEMWVNPLAYHSGYLLSHPDYYVHLSSTDESNPININCAFHGKIATLHQTLRPANWSHLAFVYKAAYGIKFTGNNSYVNCGDNQNLDMLRDMTIELSLQVEDLNREQCILYKGGIKDQQQYIAYEFFLKGAKDGNPADPIVYFRFSQLESDGNVTNHEVNTNISLEANKPTKIAITRAYVTDTDRLIEAIGKDGDHDIDVAEYSYYSYTFFQDSKSKREHTVKNGEPTGAEGDFILASRKTTEAFLKGTISDVRVWNVKRDPTKLYIKKPTDLSGLVAWWQMDENHGYAIHDSKSNIAGTIISGEWVKNPDVDASELLVYINGMRTTFSDGTAALNDEHKTFAIGAPASGKSYHGTLEEIRLWSAARTEEQIQDNLFRRIDTEYDHLLAYYDCDVVGDQLLDRAGRNFLNLKIKPEQFEYSSAPIGVELPIVRSALARINTPFASHATSAPTTVEYGDLQRDRDGNEIGVLKRAYSIIHEGHWELITGFKVGDLATEWLGQAQFDPQIIGFVEGAPPVPSENLAIDEEDNYAGAVSVELTEAKSTMYAISSSREKTFHTTVDFTLMGGMSTEVSAGVGAQVEVTEIEAVHGIHATLEYNSSSVDESEVGFGKNLTKSSSITMTGVWENEPPEGENPQHKIGRRFLPDNMGYALVQSETVDIFALRLKKSGLMVGKIVRKNPDIPVDWNIIMFPINPKYTKQGTLDGKVGHENDSEYAGRNTITSDASYFKPIEAYQLKQAIERQEQMARDIYQRFNRDDYGFFSRPDVPDISKRDIVNTYVWTADGGFFAETTETIDTIQEVLAGTYSMAGSAGYTAEWDISGGGAKIAGNLEVMLGGSLATTVSKSVGVEEGFGLEVNVEIDRDIYQRDENDNVIYDTQTKKPKKMPGKVDAYRFMTFYLSPDNRHFKELKHKVVDPVWLEKGSLNAIALRQALKNDKSMPWRILHRVTFVSRVLPESGSIDEIGIINEQHQLNDRAIISNYEIIQTVDAYFAGVNLRSKRSFEIYRSIIREYITDSSSPLYKYREHVDEIVDLMCLYHGIMPSIH